jgi:hypothetical protein
MDAHCTFLTDVSGEVLDRLVALQQIIPDELLQQALNGSGLIQERSCRLTYRVLLWVVLAMGIFTDSPIRQVFRLTRRFHKEDRIPTRSALCRGRQRLGTRPLVRLAMLAIALQCQLGDTGFYKGYRLMAIDGSVFTVPDTPANERAFGRPLGGSSPDSQGGFPQVGKVSLVEVGSHVEYRFVPRSMSRGEPTMAMRLVKYLTPDMLLLIDAGFFGYPLLRSIYGQKAQFLVNVSSTPLLKPIRELSDGSYLTKIYPTTRDRERDRGGILVRVIKYTLDDPQRTGHGETHRLVTTLLDERKHPALELIALYHERWEIELTYDEQKTHQDPRRSEKPTHLRSETPAGVIQELYALSLAHYVVRKAMFEAACIERIDPDRLSFLGAIRILRARLPECISSQPLEIKIWYENLLAEILTEKTEPRRNRINPRVIKRARCKWPTKKPQHYHPPRLHKSFTETILIL